MKINIKDYYSNLNIRSKLLFGYAAVFVIFLLISSLILYPFIRKTIESNIENNLNNTTKMIVNSIETTANASINNYLRAVAEKNKDIVEESYKMYQEGLLTEDEAKKRAESILLSQRIGRTGYIYCLDSQGVMKVHPVAKLLGSDLTRYDFIQEQLKKKNGYIEYEWENPGEAKPRLKALYMTYFKPWDWIVSASSYREEFRELLNVNNFRESILSIRFGKAGYIYVIDSKGNIIIHPVLAGNVYNVASRDGRKFVQDICREKSGKAVYTWRNPGEKEYRKKLVLFNYVPELDWIVVASSYEEDFYEPLRNIRNIFIILIVVMLATLLLLTIYYSSYIVKSLDKLICGFRAGSAGNFAVRMLKSSCDEFGKLTDSFNIFMEKLDAYDRSLQREIAHNKETEEEVEVLNEWHQSILRAATGVSIIGTDTNGIIKIFNKGAESMLGYKAEEVIDKVTPSIIHDPAEIAARAKELGVEPGLEVMMMAARKGGIERREWTYISKDGSRVPVDLSISAILNKNGKMMGFLGIASDISKRKWVEDTLEKRVVALTRPFEDTSGITIEELFNLKNLQKLQDEFARATGVASIITRPDGTPITMPSNFCRLCNDIIRKTEKGCANCYKSDAVLGQPSADGPRIQPCMSGGLWDAGAGIVVGGRHIANWLIGQVRDTTQTEENMRAYAREIGADEMAVVEAFREVPGMSQKQFTQVAQMLFTIANQLSTAAYQNVQQARFIIEQKKMEEERSQYRKHLEDEVEKRTNELGEVSRQLVQSEKMASVGQLAAGVAHEINQPLAVIKGFSQIIMSDLSNDNSMQEIFKKIVESTDRIDSVIKNFRLFARKASPEKRQIDINSTVESSFQFLEKEIRLKSITVEKHLDPTPPVNGDKNLLQQIFLNILINAMDAIESSAQKDNGKLIVRCYTESGPKPVIISIEDNGCGIPEENIAHIFNPFFTTKDPDKGTGLGLSIVYRIIQDHNGEITVKSEVGKGTIFTISLPSVIGDDNEILPLY